MIRSGHGTGAGVPRVEVCPVDELPAGVPGPARPVGDRDAAGRLRPGPGTRELARAGGRAAAEARQLAQLLGLWEPPEGHPFAPYARLAREWRDDHMATLAATVGGGEIGPGPASIVSTAAMQMASSRWAFDEGAQLGEAKLLLEFSRLADASRQNLLAAHELCAKEAVAREQDDASDLRRRQAEFQRQLAARQAETAGKHALRPAETVSGPGAGVGASGAVEPATGQPACSTATGGREGSS